MRRILFSLTAVLSSILGFSQTYNVTFQVNMNEVAPGFTTPEVNGTFNNWCGSCAAMSDANSDGIWEVVVALNAGSYEYKFSYDSWAGQEALTPGSSCTITSGAFTNRTLNVSGDAVLPVVCWNSCTDCGVLPPSYDVTFQVNMNEVGASFTTPEVNGVFNGWCGNCNAMTDNNADGIWETTLSLPQGSYTYKYSYDSWSGQEELTPGSSCTATADGFTNRTIEVTSNTVLPVVCWGSCVDCGVVELIQMDLPVTFEDATVDYGVIGFGDAVSTIEVDPTDANNTVVKVIKLASAPTWAGTTVTAAAQLGFASAIPFSSSETQMSVRVWSPDAGIPVRLKVEDHADPTHSCETDAFTTTAGSWETLIFDFANEGAGTAALNLNFTFDKASIFFNYGTDGATAGEKTYYFDDVMFHPNVLPIVHNVTFQVDMNNVTASFTTPEVNGIFNGWCGGCAPMTDSNGDGVWEITIPLEDGTYIYKYAYDSWAGQEELTAGSSCTATADGFTNRTITVTSDIVLPVVCWASCSSCEAMPVMHDVTFQVDMNNVTAAFTTPEVNGIFNGWCGNCNPMTDSNGDGIWETTISLAEGSYIYKFSYDAWAGQEELTEGSSCTATADGFTNRALTVSGDITLPVVCWGSCAACGQAGLHNVTFLVDMNNYTSPFTTPEINGTFNAWCGGCAPMSDANADGIWELTIPLESGAYEYKFAYDSWAGQENLVSGSSCTVTTGAFTNRALTVTEDVTLPVVCWESCSACNDPQGPFNVTFIVDMSNVTASYTTPEVNGTFNNWCGGCAPMSDPENDHIWELTIPLAADTFDYKFAYDSWAGQEELTEGSSCTETTDGFTNRRIIVTENTALPVVCWSSCAACVVGVEETQTPIAMELYPNPAQESVQIEFSKIIGKSANVRVTDMSGLLISSQQLNNTKRFVLDTGSFSNGIYMIQITSNDMNLVKTFVVRK